MCLLGVAGLLAVLASSCWAVAGAGGGASSPLTSPLGTGGGLSLDEGAAQAAAEVALTSPEAVVSREASRTRFEGENAAQAEQTLGEAFPPLVGSQDGGPPPLASGVSSLGFESANVEQVQAGSGDVGVVQSTVPMATASSNGQWSAVSLAPREAGGGFEPQNPLVSVRIPRHLAEGAQIPALGVSLTPVDEHGNPLGGPNLLGGSEGVVDGMGVLFANTQTDTDTVLKPSSFGFEVSSVLRSVESPEALYYRVGMPQGARLVASAGGVGAEVVVEGVAIVQIKPPLAQDAAGTAVPVSMSVSGSTLVVSVKHHEGSYLYPILVDPELSGYWQAWSNVVPGNWEFHELSGYTYEIAGAELRIKHASGSFPAEDYAIWSEKTKGYTKIFDVYVKDELYPWVAPHWLQSYIEIYKSGGGTENWVELSGNPYHSEATVCGTSGCASAEHDGEGNAFSLTLNTKEAGSDSEQFYVHASQVSTGIAQEHGKHSKVAYNTGSSQIEGETNVLAGTGAWIGPHSGRLESTSEDNGLGVSESWMEVNGSSGWQKVQSTNFLPSGSCAGIECNAKEREVAIYNTLTSNGAKPLPEPEAKLRVAAKSYMPYSSSNEYGEGETTLKVDAKPPHNIAVSGLPAKGEGGKELTLGEGPAHLVVEASDGEGTTPSSGMKEIRLGLDGYELGQSGGTCPQGPCTAAAQWSLKGSELGVGAHTLTVVAEDNTGNIETANYTLNVYAASPRAAGPGSVNPESGDFAMEASDVSMSGGLGSLALSRHYDSRNPKEGEEGPFGAPWNASLGSLASLEVLPEGSVMVTGPAGLSFFKAKSGGGFEAPEGDANLELKYEASYESGKPAYLLKDSKDATTTVFTLPEHASVWMPTVSKGPTATNTTTDEYKTVEVGMHKWEVEPTLELAPHPNVECGKGHWHAGCRALEFAYEEATTNPGEAESEWGNYKNRLKEVIAIAYNPATKTVKETPIAAYRYDKQGRLRSEWNPSISPALKTTYGYDSETDVVAATPPGQEPWLMHYGTTAQDTTPGRLLSVGRLGAKAALWNGEVLKSTAAPALSTTSPVIGTTLSTTNGTWSTTAVLYDYQWEDCNSLGAECTMILGAVNASYTPQPRDAGYKLVAEVTALNSWGAVMVATPASNVIAMPTPTYSSEFGTTGAESEKLSKPAGVAVDSEGNIWVADLGGNRIEKFSPSGAFLKSYNPDSMLEPADIAYSTTNGAIYATNRGHDRVDQLTTSGSLIRSFGAEGSTLGKLEHPNQLTVDSHGDVWIADTGNKRVDEFSSAGTYLGSNSGGQKNHKPLEAPVGIAECAGTLYVADETANEVQRIPEAGGYLSAFGSAGTENGLFSKPRQVACDPAGNDVYVVDSSNNRVQEFNSAGAFLLKLGSLGSGEGKFSSPVGVAVGPAGVLYVGDSANNRISKWKASYSTNNPTPSPPTVTENPITTIEYNVPLLGSGLQNLTSGEVAKWAQKDDPVEGAAIFPPDEPMGWPAVDYKRATIYYQDEQMRTVNVASPTGGVSTSEYSPEDEVVRALSAENRATALGEVNPAAASELLDTKSAYHEGELTDTWGPQHTVKLAKGKSEANETTLARNHVKYFYDENAPEGETYELVTKVTDGAETPSKEEFDLRTTVTSYSGQSNLGWKLRKPTSTTSDPGGLNLTRTIRYQEVTTGEGKKEPTENVEETQTPAAAGKDTHVPPAYIAQFGTKGSENGQFNEPREIGLAQNGNLFVIDAANNRVEELTQAGKYERKFGTVGSGAGQMKQPYALAVDATGNVWVTDNANNRVDEFSEKGVFIKAIGFGVVTGASEFQTCTTECKAGIAGSSTGEFKEPRGIGIGGGYVYVADGANNRVEQFSEAGAFVATFGNGVNEKGEATKLEVCTSKCKAGVAGSGEGQFKTVRGVAVAPNGYVWVADSANERIQGYGAKGEYKLEFGSAGAGPGQFKEVKGVAVTSSGALLAGDAGNNRVQEFNSSGTFIAAFGEKGTGNGQFEEAWGIAATSTGTLYVVDVGDDRVEKWVPAISGNEGAHASKVIYYTANEEAAVAACRKHPEWVGLPCQSEPIAQPGAGLPQLPITTTTYNMWNQAETIIEKFGATERKKTTTFDEAGRPLETEEQAGSGQPLPKVTDKYNEHNGTLETQRTTTGGKTQTITSVVNALDEIERYTDADGNIAEYKRDIDGRVTEVTDGSEEAIKNDGYEGKQKYQWDKTSGLMIRLEDQAVGTFTASYTVAGKITKVGYPNGMSAIYTINSAGQDTSIEYQKETNCPEKCAWFTDQEIPSIHGEAITQTSSLSSEVYGYGAAGWLNEVQEIPTGEGCKTRIYTHDEEGNRTALTTRSPATENKCASEGGSTEWHTYDTGNHVTDTGASYDPFGNATALPASDAGGEALTSSYYVDSQLYRQTQSGTTIEYQTDPEARTRETITTKGSETTKLISHYDGPGNTLTWTFEPTTGKWTRNIPGIDGTLTATQTSTTAPVLLLHDLQGNVIAEASISPIETKLLKTYNSTEYGVPTTKTAPPKYAWLGATGLASELPSGTITQDGGSYVPQTGRSLQTEAVEPPEPLKYYAQYERPNAEGATWGPAAAALRSAESKQAEHAQELAESPPGEIPSAEGSSGCIGMHACAASRRRSQKCTVKVMVGEEHGKAWSRAWMSCGTMRMPANSFLFTCLTEESADGFSPTGAVTLGCDNAVRGEQYPHQLYSNYLYGSGCPSGVILHGIAGFWMPGWAKMSGQEAEGGWQCGESDTLGIANFVWFVVETVSGHLS
jgi:sugar lactone lactonase YvrE